jgi:hypothetical protein
MGACGASVGGVVAVIACPAWTVCATAVEIVDSSACDGPHAETSNVIAIITANIL